MLPPVSQLQLELFARYVRYYLGRNFHALHLAKFGALDALDGHPLLVCVNHPSWWDPLVGVHLAKRLFADRVHYAPIAAAGVSKYKFFERLGFFGIDSSTRDGASRFLRIGGELLSRPNGAFWVTPQGQFIDTRTRPVKLQPGVGHLTRRAKDFAMLPVALEYSFWNERYPEAFAGIGEPVLVERGAERSADAWTEIFAAALQETQDRLSALVMRRDPDLFESLLGGASGIGGMYDLWRALKARTQGKRFDAGHGRM